jgi:hypothetical protein
MNLGVINSPDNPGAACDFQPYSFYLDGKRTYWGLPNNPDYDMLALSGSPCDTLVGIAEPPEPSHPEFFVYYSPTWQTVFINAQKLTGKTYSLQVYDVTGHQVHKESGNLSSTYFNQNLNCAGFAKGIYLIKFETESDRLVRKLILE